MTNIEKKAVKASPPSLPSSDVLENLKKMLEQAQSDNQDAAKDIPSSIIELTKLNKDVKHTKWILYIGFLVFATATPFMHFRLDDRVTSEIKRLEESAEVRHIHINNEIQSNSSRINSRIDNILQSNYTKGNAPSSINKNK